MQAKYKNIITLQYNGAFQDKTTQIFIQSFVTKLKKLKDDGVRGYLISLKSAHVANDIQALKNFVKQLNLLRKKENISISLMEYDDELYDHLVSLVQFSDLSLYKTVEIARLFLYPQNFDTNLSIVLYQEDEKSREQLLDKLAQFELKTINIASEFEIDKYTDKTKYLLIEKTILRRQQKTQAGALQLSKKLILNLPIFMDTAVDTLVSFTALEAKKVGHAIKSFEMNIDNGSICAMMEFKGDFDGMFLLVFPKDIALITMEALLGEAVDENDNEAIQDGIAELCNIITGSSKTLFSKKDIKVLFELPKTYLSLNDLDSSVRKNNGIWIDMQLDAKPFYMFITK